MTLWTSPEGASYRAAENFNTFGLLDRIFDMIDGSCSVINRSLDEYIRFVNGDGLSFNNDDTIKNIDYSYELTDLDYFYRYGFAYAYEYMLLYRIMLYAWGANDINVLSLGCGSLIDGIALAAARARVAFRKEGEQSEYHNVRLEYTGYDLKKWGSMGSIIHRDVNNDCFNKLSPDGTDDGLFRLLTEDDTRSGLFNKIELHIGEDEGNILGAFGEGRRIEQNIIIFPKLLNELPESVIDELVERVGQTGFPDNFLLCVSHSRHNIMAGLDAVERLVNAINRGDTYIVNENVIKSVNESKNLFTVDRQTHSSTEGLIGSKLTYPGNSVADVLTETIGIDCSGMTDYKQCYAFTSFLNGPVGANEKRYGKCIWEIDSSFNERRFNSVRQLKDALSDAGYDVRKPINRVSHFVFQILRFRRR